MICSWNEDQTELYQQAAQFARTKLNPVKQKMIIANEIGLKT